MPNVNLAPYVARQRAIDRRRQLAAALQQDAYTPIEAPPVAGALISPWQGVAKIAQAFAAAMANRRLDKQEQALAREQEATQASRSMSLANALAPQRPGEDALSNLSMRDALAQALSTNPAAANALLSQRQLSAEQAYQDARLRQQQEFQTGERLAGQEFTAGQNLLTRQDKAPPEVTPGNYVYQNGQWTQIGQPNVPRVSAEQQEMDSWLTANPGKTPADFMVYKSGLSGMQDESALQLTPEGLDAAALMYAQTGTLPAMGMGKQAAGVRTRIINRAAERYPSLDVATNKAEYTANLQSLAALQKNRDAVVAFENTANKNLDQFLETAKSIVDSGSPLLNRPLRGITASVAGNANIAAFEAARRVAVNEIAKVTSNPNLTGQLSDAARHEVEASPGRRLPSWSLWEVALSRTMTRVVTSSEGTTTSAINRGAVSRDTTNASTSSREFMGRSPWAAIMNPGRRDGQMKRGTRAAHTARAEVRSSRD